MQYGIEVVSFGADSDPRSIVDYARVAEAAGWEALWIWDHMLFPWGCADPWIALAAAACATTKLKLITGVAPIPRYQPHLLARQLSGLDLLSNGRVILGAGLGVDFDFVPFGAATDMKTRAAMTDEGLDLLNQYLSGKEVMHHGAHYHAERARIAPSPVQRPRIPVWIGGDSPSAFRRAARWDGWIMVCIDEHCAVTKTPEQIATCVQQIRSHRTSDGAFDVAIDGASKLGETTLVREYAAAGATWYFEIVFGRRGTKEEMIARIMAGPPG